MMRKLSLAAGLGLAVSGVGFQSRAAENDAESATRGAKVYEKFCAQCHGTNMVNPGNASFDLRNLTVDEHNRFLNSVMNGKRAMPAWDGVVTRPQVEDLWAYVLTAKTRPALPPKK